MNKRNSKKIRYQSQYFNQNHYQSDNYMSSPSLVKSNSELSISSSKRDQKSLYRHRIKQSLLEKLNELEANINGRKKPNYDPSSNSIRYQSTKSLNSSKSHVNNRIKAQSNAGKLVPSKSNPNQKLWQKDLRLEWQKSRSEAAQFKQKNESTQIWWLQDDFYSNDNDGYFHNTDEEYNNREYIDGNHPNPANFRSDLRQTRFVNSPSPSSVKRAPSSHNYRYGQDRLSPLPPSPPSPPLRQQRSSSRSTSRQSSSTNNRQYYDNRQPQPNPPIKLRQQLSSPISYSSFSRSSRSGRIAQATGYQSTTDDISSFNHDTDGKSNDELQNSSAPLIKSQNNTYTLSTTLVNQDSNSCDNSPTRSIQIPSLNLRNEPSLDNTPVDAHTECSSPHDIVFREPYQKEDFIRENTNSSLELDDDRDSSPNFSPDTFRID